MLNVKVILKHRRLGQMLKKLVPAAMRPLLEQANSAAVGLATVRSFGRTQFYIEQVYDLIDINTKVGWHLALGIVWMNVRTGVLGAVFVTTIAVTLVSQGADAATVGLITTLALQLKNTIAGTLGKLGILTMGANAVDRVLDLAATPTETGKEDEPPESWPASGAVEVYDLTLHYDVASPPSLTAVSFSVKPHQRLGIVGRTGAGKPSLTNALLHSSPTTLPKTAAAAAAATSPTSICLSVPEAVIFRMGSGNYFAWPEPSSPSAAS